jgi:hypothetical protein
MVYREALLVTLVKLVDRVPFPEAPPNRGRGRPRVYSDRLMVKALVIMIVRRLYRAYSLLAFLEQDTRLTRQLGELLTENEQFPSRRTWERRLKALPATLPGLIGCLGRYLVQTLCPYAHTGRAAALDSTALRAKGGVWHQKHRDQGEILHSSIDTEAHWSKSGHHGWWYGWKLHLACTVSALWIPLAAELTPANTYDATLAPQLARELPEAVRFVMGDSHYRDEVLQDYCFLTGRVLMTPRSGPYPHQGAGVEVRKILHRLRHQAIEPFNGLFKNIFDWGGQVPVKGLRRTRLIVLGAVFVYQLVLLFQHEHDKPLGQAIKPFLRAA